MNFFYKCVPSTKDTHIHSSANREIIEKHHRILTQKTRQNTKGEKYTRCEICNKALQKTLLVSIWNL